MQMIISNVARKKVGGHGPRGPPPFPTPMVIASIVLVYAPTNIPLEFQTLESPLARAGPRSP